MSNNSKYNITVIGIGAMGGGMARALLEAPCSQTVTAYDRAAALVDAFQGEAVAAGKAAAAAATIVQQAAVFVGWNKRWVRTRTLWCLCC